MDERVRDLERRAAVHRSGAAADVTWTPEERAAWPAPEPLTGSEWAERYVRIPDRGNAEPGAYDLRRTPYMREIIDVLTDREHEEVILMKPPQVGGSQAGRVAIGNWADRRGDPILLVYPNQDAASEEIVDRVAPMFAASPQLARHLTGRTYDVNEGEIHLAGSTIFVGWTGSAQTMASRAIGCAIYEETDKGVRKGGEATADKLIRHRLKTFKGRRKFYAVSTPTTRTGAIFCLWSETKHKREYYCSCPKCGALDLWGFDGVRWDGRDRPDAKEPAALLEVAEGIESGALSAWYECSHCHAQIFEDERPSAVEAGEWVSVGHAPGVRPRSKRVAYHLEALVSPWVTFGDYVAAYLRGALEGDLQDFYNGFRGLPAEEVMGRVADSVFEERGREYRAWVVPAWASWLTAGADTQAVGGRPYWVWLIRAWGPGLRSRLIGWGRSDSPEELVARTVGATFPVEGGGRMGPAVLCVDSGGGVEVESGTTTDLVYALSKRDPARIVAVKGHGGATRPDRLVRTSNVDYQAPGMPPTSVLLHTLDTERLKDILARLIRAAAPVLWEESSAVDQTYVEQMTSEERVVARVGRTKRSRWINTTRRRNDLWDATVYALAAAKILKVEERAIAHEQAKQAPTPPPEVAQHVSSAARHADPSATRGDEQPRRFGGRISARGDRPWISRRGR